MKQVETFRLGKSDYVVKNILAFYSLADKEGYHVSAYTTHGTDVVCKSVTQEGIEEKMDAINDQLHMMGLGNFAYMGGSIVNIDAVAHMDIQNTPWEARMVVADFRNGQKLTIGEEIKDAEGEEKARLIIQSYEEQKSDYRNATASFKAPQTLTTPKEQ